MDAPFPAHPTPAQLQRRDHSHRAQTAGDEQHDPSPRGRPTVRNHQIVPASGLLDGFLCRHRAAQRARPSQYPCDRPQVKLRDAPHHRDVQTLTAPSQTARTADGAVTRSITPRAYSAPCAHRPARRATSARRGPALPATTGAPRYSPTCRSRRAAPEHLPNTECPPSDQPAGALASRQAVIFELFEDAQAGDPCASVGLVGWLVSRHSCRGGRQRERGRAGARSSSRTCS